MIGILGGMGTQAGLDFCTKLAKINRGKADQNYPLFVLYNKATIPDRKKNLKKYKKVLNSLLEGCKFLQKNKCKFISIPCNTAHYWYEDLRKKVNCVEDPKAKVVGAKEGKARSTSRYSFEGLGDWLKLSNPNSKVISIAGKDRAACLLGGKMPDLSTYYNMAGSFISSDYYVDKLPDLLDDFNSNLNIDSYKDSIWEKSLKMQVYFQT